MRGGNRQRKVPITWECQDCKKISGPWWSPSIPKRCKECKRAFKAKRAAELRAEDPERHREYQKTYRLKTYGVSIEEATRLEQEAQGTCQICGDTSKPLYLDHHHTLRRARGLLCRECNKALGLFKDDSAILRSAAEYLETFLRTVENDL